jgi:hypothetical protein
VPDIRLGAALSPVRGSRVYFGNQHLVPLASRLLWAANFQVNPIQIILMAKTSSALLALRNTSSEILPLTQVQSRDEQFLMPFH